MTAAVGTAGVVLGLLASLIGAAALALGVRRRDERLLRTGRQTVFLTLVGALVAVAAMEWALLTHDFSLQYVASNGSRSTPVLYTVASLWGALEGSILLWALVLAGFLSATARRFRKRESDPLVAWALLTGLLVAAFFFWLVLGPADPFRLVSGPTPLDGPGPNPLLQNHPLMAFHPPILYVGYVGFTIPFAFAVAALVTGRLGEGWLLATRRTTMLAWGSLTAGIVLGAWWSYEVLGWGGYWAWDPVENASLLPWLTATAYLHSVVVQERRGMLRVWNLSLVLATFALTILGTFLTRSGVINSVHAFTQSPIGPALLAFLAVVAVIGVALIAWRADLLHSPGRIDSAVSREAAFLANNLLFGAFAFVVLLGTVFPILAEAWDGRQLSVGEPYFDEMTMPIGFALLFLMAVAPALPWRAAGTDVLHRRLLVPAAVAAGTMLLAAVFGLSGIAPLVTFGLGAFALAGIVRQVVVATRGRRLTTSEAWPVAIVRLVAAHRRLYGGLVVHVGVVAVAVAFAMSSTFAVEREARLTEGQSATVAGYEVTYLGSGSSSSGRKTTVTARLGIERGGRRLGVYEPALSTFRGSAQAIGTPSVRTGIREDLYLTLVATPAEGGDEVVVGLRVNPLVVWLWIGSGVMVAGTALAAWPTRRPRRPSRPHVLAGSAVTPATEGDVQDRDDRVPVEAAP